MSYPGSVGQIMWGSGLAELWEQENAKGSVIHMLDIPFRAVYVLTFSLRLPSSVLYLISWIELTKINWRAFTDPSSTKTWRLVMSLKMSALSS